MKNGTELENERINPSGYLHFRLLRGAKGLAMTRGRKGEWLRATFTKGRGMRIRKNPSFILPFSKGEEWVILTNRGMN
jgi:hypothetical protein